MIRIEVTERGSCSSGLSPSMFLAPNGWLMKVYKLKAQGILTSPSEDARHGNPDRPPPQRRLNHVSGDLQIDEQGCPRPQRARAR